MKDENAGLQKELEEELERVDELERASSVVASQLKQHALEKERKLNEEKQGLIIDNERLKGRLAGTETAQNCLREHVDALENSVAQKESQLSQLLADNAALVSEKEQEIEDLNCKYESLQDSMGDLKAELEKTLTEALFNKQKVDELERVLVGKEAELNLVKENKDDKKEKELLKEQLQVIEDRKEELQVS